MPAWLSKSPLTFAPVLNSVQWAVLAGVPVGIIALYFLKLRRRPVQVSSTLLWRRSLEDLHVNSLFQRLRKNILLFLQLLAVAMAMLALAGPRFLGSLAPGQRFVLAIDESASMAASDIAPTRLDKAKSEALKVVNSMKTGDLAMIVAFSDRARVVSNYSGNRDQLRQRIASIQPTQAKTNLREALQVVAGLANPSSDRDAREGVVATDAMVPPQLYVLTDGGFLDIEGFSIGKIIPNFVVVGPAPPPREPVAPTPGKPRPLPAAASDNVAILALSSARNEEKPDQFQVFGRVKNYRDEEVKTEARLLRHDPDKPTAPPSTVDAQALTIPARSEQSFQFDLTDNGLAELEVKLDVKDSLALDNHAFTVFGNQRKAQILLVTAGNRYLRDAAGILNDVADVAEMTPEQSKTPGSLGEVRAGKYDLIVYDGERPDAAPDANTLYFGVLPPGKDYEHPREITTPTILDWNVAHPIMQYVRDLSNVLIQKAVTCDPPNGATVLIESNLGPLAFAAPRGGFVDVVIGFKLLDGTKFNTNWQLLRSFPLFLFNTVRALGNGRERGGSEDHPPDQTVLIRGDSTASVIDVSGPDGKLSERVKRSPQGGFAFTKANATGIYHAQWGDNHRSSFAVNLFDPRESDLSTRGLAPAGATKDEAEAYEIKIGFTPVAGTNRALSAVKDWWMYLATAMLAVVLLEWYVYNRRVYI